MNKIFNYTTYSVPIKKISLFLAGGAFNFLIKIALTVLLTEYIKLPYYFSYIATLSIIILYSFFYNAYLTFKVHINLKSNFLKYIVALLTFNILDAGLVRLLTESLGVYYILSIVVTTVCLLVFKYVVYNSIVFTKQS